MLRVPLVFLTMSSFKGLPDLVPGERRLQIVSSRPVPNRNGSETECKHSIYFTLHLLWRSAEYLVGTQWTDGERAEWLSC